MQAPSYQSQGPGFNLHFVISAGLFQPGYFSRVISAGSMGTNKRSSGLQTLVFCGRNTRVRHRTSEKRVSRKGAGLAKESTGTLRLATLREALSTSQSTRNAVQSSEILILDPLANPDKL